MQCLAIFLTALFSCHFAFAQIQNPEAKRASTWYFGLHAGMDFNAPTPTPLLDNLYDFEQQNSAGICDLNGNLLFTVWYNQIYDRDQQPMPGNQTLPNPLYEDPHSNPYIVPAPGYNSLYYVFWLHDMSFFNPVGQRQLRYSMEYQLVDMALNGGKGDLIGGPVLMDSTSGSNFTIVRHCNEKDFWILGADRETGRFKAWLLDENGMADTPVWSNNPELTFTGWGESMKMKPSPDGTMLVYSSWDSTPDILHSVLSFFDAQTGVFIHVKKRLKKAKAQ
ncbi:MAG: hypothetical protein AAF570_02025 [Bacteroidota bacterium]